MEPVKPVPFPGAFTLYWGRAVVKPIENGAGKGKRRKRMLGCNDRDSGSNFAALEREQTSV